MAAAHRPLGKSLSSSKPKSPVNMAGLPPATGADDLLTVTSKF